MATFVYTARTFSRSHAHCLSASSSIYYDQQRSLSFAKTFKNWMKGSDERGNKKAWYGEARRFLEYEQYTLYSFDSHLRTTVDSYDKAGAGRRFFRWLMKWANKDADSHQRKMVDESRQLLHIMDTFPTEAFEDPKKYFRGLNRSKLAMETKLQTGDIAAIMDKFENQKETHRLLREKVSKGQELPASAADMQMELAAPHSVIRNFREKQAFNAANPNRTNPVYEKYIEEWNHKVWLTPYRLRQGYRIKKNWKTRDWRQYQPKWDKLPPLDFSSEEYQKGAKKKLYPDDYSRKEKIAYTKPSWMKKYAWRQAGDRLIELRNDHQNGIGEHIDLYNYDRFRSVHDQTDMKERVTKPPKYGGNKRGYHH